MVNGEIGPGVQVVTGSSVWKTGCGKRTELK